MAPEMITNGQHNHTLDVWCLGILLYELLHGRAPFKGDYPTIKERIFNGKIKFKKSLPEDARDLIKSLLQRDANDRIPLIKVFTHPWVLRLQEKHNLSRENSVVQKSQKQQDRYDDEEEKDLPVKKIRRNRKQLDDPPISGVDPRQLDSKLQKLDNIDGKKKRVLAPSKQEKFGNIFKSNPQKITNEEESHNLLDLSGFGVFKEKQVSNIDNKFEKLQKIEIGATRGKDTESSIPFDEDVEFSQKISEKQEEIDAEKFLQEELLEPQSVQKKPDEIKKLDLNFVKKKPDMDKSRDGSSKPKYSPRPQFDDSSSDEENILNQLGKKMQDTSFIAGNKDLEEEYQSQEKKKGEIMDLIGGIGGELDTIEIDDSERPRGKSDLSKSYSDLSTIVKKKKNPEI